MFRKYMFITVANDESSSTYVRWLMMINARVQEFSRNVIYIIDNKQLLPLFANFDKTIKKILCVIQ